MGPYALDWDEVPENDDHLPFEERGWVKRMREREAAAERFDREYPDVFFNLGRAVAKQQQELAIKILMEG